MTALANLNFRDLGGTPVAGGTIRPGLIYRSEGPASFAEDHRAELSALGFRAICDLRSPGERAAHPNDWATGARLLDLDILADVRAQEPGRYARAPGVPMHESARETMRRNYRAMPVAIGPHLVQLTDLILGGETPLLVHCTAGKDRTGVLIAVLLLLLGASRQTAAEDYLRSTAFLARPGATDGLLQSLERAWGEPIDRPTLEAIAGVDIAYLDAALDEIERSAGSFDAFFFALSFDPDKRAALVAAAIEPEPAQSLG